jgi:hypothetical protein
MFLKPEIPEGTPTWVMKSSRLQSRLTPFLKNESLVTSFVDVDHDEAILNVSSATGVRLCVAKVDSAVVL